MKFKENKTAAIEKAKEAGDAANKQGSERVKEARAVKNLIDGLRIRDEIDIQQADILESSYSKAFEDAHKNEVEIVVDSKGRELKTEKDDVQAERENIESARDSVKEMKGKTDLAQGTARNTEQNFDKSAKYYADLEKLADNTISDQKSKSDSSKSEIKSIFG